MALTPQEKSQLPVRTQRLPPGAAEQLSKVPKPAAAPAALPPGARPTITVDSQGRASAATIRPPVTPPLQATPLPTPQPTGGARTVPTGGDGTAARLEQLKAERAARAAPRAAQAAATPAAQALAGKPPVGPASPLGAVPPGAPAAAVPPATPAAAALGTAPAATPASPGIVSRVAGKVQGGARAVGRYAAPVGVLLEGADVARVAQDPNATGLDVAEQSARGATRLSTAYLGMKGGAAGGTALGGPVGGAIGGLLGGTVGFIGGPRLIDAANSMGETPNSKKGENIGRGIAPSLSSIPGAGGVLAQFAPQIGSYFGALTDAPDTSPAARAPEVGAAPAAPAETPAAAASQVAGAGQAQAADPSAADVLGTFNGRQITRGDAANIADRLPVVGGGNGTGIIPPSAAQPAAARLGATVGSVSSSGQRKLAKQLDETLKGLGDLNMRGKRDLAAQLLGLKTRLVEGKAGNDTRLAAEQAQIDSSAAAAQLGADVQREGFQTRSGGSPIVGEDGNLYTLQGNTLAPITGADGKPAKAPTSNKEAQALYADLVKQLTVGGETPEQILAIQQQAAQLAGIGGTADAAPKGYTRAGTTPDGQPVYKDAEGNTFTQ